MKTQNKIPIPTDIIVKYLKEHPQAKDISDEQMKKLEQYADQHLPRYITNVRDIEPQLIALVDIAFVNKPLGWLFKPFAMPHVKTEINKIINKYRENHKPEVHKSHKGSDDIDNIPTKSIITVKRRPTIHKDRREHKHAIKEANKTIKRCRKSKIQVRIIKDQK